jgi:O-antigen/teichoic acid export membrane protein
MNKILSKLKSSGNFSTLFKNLSWSIISRIVQIINSLVIGVIVARYLKPELYGILNYSAGYIAMFPLITEFGLTSILIRELAKKNTNKDELLGTSLLIRLLLSVFTIILIALSLYFFEDDNSLRIFIFINSFNFLFLSFSMTINNYFNSQLQNEKNAKSEIFRVSILALLKVACIIFKAPLMAFIILAAVDSAVILLYSIPVFAKSYGSLRNLKFSLNCGKGLMVSSFPLFIEGITGVFYQKIDVVLTGKMVNTEAVAYYSVALKFIDFAIFIPLVIVQTLTPMLVKKFEEAGEDKKHPTYVEFKNKLGDLVTYSGLVISLFLFIAARPLILILYGHEYEQSILILQILSLKGLLCGLGYSASAMIITEGRQRISFLTNIIGGATNIILSLILIPAYGIVGVALSTIISFSIGTYFANFFIPLYRIDFLYQTGFLFKGAKRITKYLKGAFK